MTPESQKREVPPAAPPTAIKIKLSIKNPTDTHGPVGVINSENSGTFLATGEQANSIANVSIAQRGLALQALCVNEEGRSEQGRRLGLRGSASVPPVAGPWRDKMAGVAGLEPVTSAVTGQRSNQLSYTPAWGSGKNSETFPARQCSTCKKGDSGSRRQGGGGGEPR